MSRNPRGLVPINGELRSSGGNGSIHTNPILLSSSTLGIIYSLVARIGGGAILAHHACCHGNFTEVARQVLRNIRRETETRLSYASGEYMYHFISCESMVFLCITDDEFERSKAFLFLEDIKGKFMESYEHSTIQSALPFAMNSEFSDVLKETMNHYSNASISLLPAPKLDNIKVRDLELLNDGQLEQLELLESTDSVSMRSYDSILDPQLKARLCDWLQDHWKLMVVVLLVGVFVLVVMVAIVLGVCLEDEKNTCAR